jgi:bloom syndrome protein
MGGGSSSNGAPTFDNDSGGHNNDSYGTHSNNYSEPSSSNNNDTPPCPGHNMPCRLLMANTASNMGRQFYKCSMPEGQACDFFEWADGMEGNMNNDLDNGGGSIVSGSKKDMYTENQRIFGHRSFRLGQKEVIQQAISGRDVFVLMPTGGGKSLCYQLPAWCCPGVAIIVSPLLSLIQDQVQSMTKVGVRSVFLNSKQDYETEQKDILQELEHNTPAHGGIKLLYLTPEKLTHSTSMKRILRKLYERGLLSRIVVDEAHCLSDWGHDFRPDYNQLGKLRREFPNTPLMALTATANEKVVNDAIRALGMRNEYTYRSSFNRKNLHYEVRKKDGKVVDAIADHIATKPRESGVVYCLSRKNCEDVAKKLQGKLREKGCGHIRVSFYHAQVEQTERDRRHHAWSIGKISVLCATIAFGMGIDKPGKSCLLNMERSPCPSSNADTLFAACTDVRYVIHYSMPKSITH